MYVGVLGHHYFGERCGVYLELYKFIIHWNIMSKLQWNNTRVNALKWHM